MVIGNSLSNINVNRLPPSYSSYVVLEIKSENDSIVLSNKQIGKEYSDPQFISSVTVNKSIVGNDSSAVSTIQTYVEDYKRAHDIYKNSKGKEKDSVRYDNYVNSIKSASERLEASIQSITDSYAKQSSIQGAFEATISLSFLRDISIMTKLYNYFINQKMDPSISLTYGILGDRGEPLRSSDVLEGIILEATTSNFYDMTIKATLFPSKYISWDVKKFNEIFTPSKKKDKDKSSNNNNSEVSNGDGKKSNESEDQERRSSTLTDEKFNNYSKIVRKIAEGLGWDIGLIEPTLDLSEEINIVDPDFKNEGGPLGYIADNFCSVDYDDKSGKKSKAGAVSINGIRDGYIAYVDMIEGKYKFFYVPKRYLTRKILNNIKIYNYSIMQSNDKEGYYSEVLEFQSSPINLRGKIFNKNNSNNGDVSIASYQSLSKQLEDKKIKAVTVTDNDKINSFQGIPFTLINFSDETKYSLDKIRANLNYIVSDTFISAGNATLRVIYDNSLRLMNMIFVAVILPMNDSVSLDDRTLNKDLLHPSSGLYYITGITDEISDSGATTTLSLTKNPITQETIDGMNRFIDAVKGNYNKGKQ